MGMLGMGAALCGGARLRHSVDPWWGEEWLEEVHETAANAMLVLAGVHVLAAVLASFRHRENLILALITGRADPGRHGRTGLRGGPLRDAGGRAACARQRRP